MSTTETSSTTPEIHEVTESDWQTLYQEQRAETERLATILAASRIAPATPPREGKAPVSADALRARVGTVALNNMTRAQKLASLGIADPTSVDDEFLRKCFGRGNSGVEARELHNSNAQRYDVLKQCAKVLNIFAN